VDLIAPDALDFLEIVVDWMWLVSNDPSLFVSGHVPGGRVISPPDWQMMAFWVNFSATRSDYMLSKRVLNKDK